MAEEWKCTLTQVVRCLINDLDNDNLTYTDEKIQQLIVCSAQLIKLEVDFNNSYTISVVGVSISPDPVTSPPDDGFITLVSLKTACLITGGELKSIANGAVRVQDGPSQIDMTGAYTASKDLYDKLCRDYDKAKIAYTLGNLNEIKAVLTPYTVPYNVYPQIQFG